MMLIFIWYAYKFKKYMKMGYHSNLQDICKNITVLLGPKHELAPTQCKGKLVGWLVGWFDDLRRISDISAILRLGSGGKQSPKS